MGMGDRALGDCQYLDWPLCLYLLLKEGIFSFRNKCSFLRKASSCRPHSMEPLAMTNKGGGL